MNGIRPLTPGDLPAIAALRQRSFEHSSHSSSDSLLAYLERLFFSNPWTDASHPSLVYESEGEIVGFLGVVARRFVYRGEMLQAAVGTQFMVAPESRGMIGLQLLWTFLNGAQDLSLADLANATTKRIWEGLGGRSALLFSLYWVRPLRPARHAASWLGDGLLARGVRLAARPLLNGVDARLARRGRSSFRSMEPPTPQGPLEPEILPDVLPRVLNHVSLRPDYDMGELRWLLGELAEKRELGALDGATVRTPGGDVAGWYLFLSNPGGVGQVVQMAARAGEGGVVLDQLFHHAWQRGLVAIAGRLEPTFTEELHARRCAFTRDGPWVLVHARRPDVLNALERGDAFFSRLDGEWWMSF